MGTHQIRMPDVGEGITEAEIVEWNVAVGDVVREDDILAAVMTDKATIEIPSPVEGKVVEISGEVGEMTAVGTPIITIEVEGAGTAASAKPAAGKKPEAPAADEPPGAEPEKTPEPRKEPEAKPKPEPSGSAAPAPKAAPRQAPAAPPRPAGEKPLASPAVRRRATEAGVRLAYVRGSGPAGRITHEDLDNFLRGEQTPVAVGRPAADTRVEEIKVIGLRRRIAERMQEAKRHIPHITYVEEVDVTELEELRQHLNSRGGETRLTVLPFIVRALVLALKEHPKLSALYDDENNLLQQYAAAHVGIATQTPGGLMVPVLRHAEALSLADIAAELGRLAEAARDGSIGREELTGSTITISSLGALGGIVSTPVINRPEVAIVGVNKIAVRPVHRDGGFVPRKIMNLSSAFDHRIVDGWDAAMFVQAIRQRLEHPATLFMED